MRPTSCPGPTYDSFHLWEIPAPAPRARKGDPLCGLPQGTQLYCPVYLVQRHAGQQTVCLTASLSPGTALRGHCFSGEGHINGLPSLWQEGQSYACWVPQGPWFLRLPPLFGFLLLISQVAT